MVFAVFEVEIVAAEDEVGISPSFFRHDLVRFYLHSIQMLLRRN